MRSINASYLLTYLLTITGTVLNSVAIPATARVGVNQGHIMKDCKNIVLSAIRKFAENSETNAKRTSFLKVSFSSNEINVRFNCNAYIAHGDSPKRTLNFPV